MSDNNLPNWVFAAFFLVIVVWGFIGIANQTVGPMPTGYVIKTQKVDTIVQEEGGECVDNRDCGVDGCFGTVYCQGSNIICSNYVTKTCSQPDTAQSTCYTQRKFNYVLESCNSHEFCRNGVCVPKNAV